MQQIHFPANWSLNIHPGSSWSSSVAPAAVAAAKLPAGFHFEVVEQTPGEYANANF
jgi:hypothetical protein